MANQDLPVLGKAAVRRLRRGPRRVRLTKARRGEAAADANGEVHFMRFNKLTLRMQSPWIHTPWQSRC